MEVRLNTLHQHITGLADAAADDNYLGIDGGADTSQEQAHVAVNTVQNSIGSCITGLSCIEDVLAGDGPTKIVSISLR